MDVKQKRITAYYKTDNIPLEESFKKYYVVLQRTGYQGKYQQNPSNGHWP